MKRILLLLPRINLFLHHNQGRILKIILLALVFITALYTKEYTGEFQTLITSHIGGILYVLFGALLFSLVFTRMASWQSALLALSITSMLEFVQYLRIPFMIELTRYKVFLYLLGNSFNWMDFVYYVMGAVLGYFVVMLIGHREG